MILDTETTDLFGHVVQIGIVDLQGRTLMNTLVRPPAAITDEATAIHGLDDAAVAAAPSLSALAPVLLELTAGRQVLAYNASYDRQVLVDGLIAAGVDPGHLHERRRWSCLMRARARHDGLGWVKLDGPHDALGDCRAALQVLRTLAAS
ncbi:3'-5' exonuclease [uncultured Cellulomonas sp.]|uniref:3'-5' exonuclease n=1 Tax=uncultured Cellulomonas sp. TaxID=189682 RepID=UPI00260703A9|nr:3'-5' exonuclease [uncultured Cellulomonas sp.]